MNKFNDLYKIIKEEINSCRWCNSPVTVADNGDKTLALHREPEEQMLQIAKENENSEIINNNYNGTIVYHGYLEFMKHGMLQKNKIYVTPLTIKNIIIKNNTFEIIFDKSNVNTDPLVYRKAIYTPDTAIEQLKQAKPEVEDWYDGDKYIEYYGIAESAEAVEGLIQETLTSFVARERNNIKQKIAEYENQLNSLENFFRL